MMFIIAKFGGFKDSAWVDALGKVLTWKAVHQSRNSRYPEMDIGIRLSLADLK
ncbi:hypothetical protein ACNQ6O_14700 [Marinobacter sp. SBS5]|uniref:hypothetical protein n=1 Tax=Marinobacter sp. SBS5 TaxID=3401754 RepID=UPI003AAE4CDE